MRREKKIIQPAIWVMSMMLLLFLAACGSPEKQFANTFQIYYINNEETGLVSRTYQTDSTEVETLVVELLELLSTMPEKLEYKSPLSGSFNLLDYSIAEGQVILSFDDRYKDLPVINETLVRAALVRTLTQIKEISHVSFLIRSDPLVDSTGNIVGVMSADMFIDNAGREMNAYEKIKLRLYFGSEDGESLIAVTRNGVVYNSNVAIEKVVVENLIAGPLADEKAYPTINSGTKILGITVKDGICYVNLDNMFLNQLNQVNATTTIYSIANSLVELPNVNKVQISVNGSTNVVFKENVNLSTIFERNLDIVVAN